MEGCLNICINFNGYYHHLKSSIIMKLLIKLSLMAILIALLSGCAVHSGIMNNSAALNEANFSYRQQSISGSSEAKYIFGIGGLDKQALVDEAKKDMLKNYELQPNQALANVTVNWKNTFILVVIKTQCTVTADIVEFD